MQKEVNKSRLKYLDYLRGYFVIVIVVDHLSRFPSAWQYVTGRGVLWATAAEGFVMISGLMIGYVRGLKNSNKSFLDVAFKLLKRSLLLYIWMVIGSMAYVALTWQLANHRNMPWYNATEGDWATVWDQVITMQVPHVWVHFLYLYAIFLLLSIPAVWLLRQKQPWLLACFSVIGYIYGQTASIEWLKIQVLFFIPAIVGYYLPNIQLWWRNNRFQKPLTWIILGSTVATMLLSTVYVFAPEMVPNASLVNGLFETKVFGPPRIAISALWFTALVIIFKKITPWLEKNTFGVIGYLGTHSLTAYVVHGLAILIISLLLLPADNYLINTLLGFAVVIGVYLLIKAPILRRLLPR